MVSRSLCIPVICALLGLGTLAEAQSSQPVPASAPAPAQPPSPTCEAPEHHQFDFWIGEWTVRGPAGRVVGTNRIEQVLGGCAIVEHWTSSGGNHGTSLNFYDRTARQWTQTWIDNAGQPLTLAGALRDGRMVMAGTTPGGAGAAATQQRITWTPLEGGDVRQVWESSTDGGATWTIAFDGRYSRTTAK